MGFRFTGIVRVCLVAAILLMAWYTVQLYAQLFARLKDEPSTPKEDTPINVDSDKAQIKVDDPDGLVDKETIDKAAKDWEKNQGNLNPSIKKPSKNPCLVSSVCKTNEISFKIITGAANVIGPSVCLNDSIVMKNSLNNVDRGMNIALVDGKIGKCTKQLVFDLYGKDSTELKAFLKELKPHEVIVVTTYDDAAFKLDDEAKEMLTKIGSKHAKGLAFRDNWAFVGGESVKEKAGMEQIVKNEKEKNKYGDWPEAFVLEGCIPLVPS